MTAANSEEYKTMSKMNEALVRATHSFFSDLKITENCILTSTAYKHLESNARQMLESYQLEVNEKEKL